MSCCAPGTEGDACDLDGLPMEEELREASRPVGDGLRQTDLSVPGVHCGACIVAVENALKEVDGVVSARVNLSTRRVAVQWADGAHVPPFCDKLASIGYPAHIFDFETDDSDAELSRLMRAVAVAGFAASNIMLLSVSVWSGAEGATRDVFHLISAIIAIPALAYSGRIFFLSAWSALRHGRTNMDVPISIGVLLAYGMSLYDTLNHGENAYFDAAVTLLFFLLIGRTLDHVMRERARKAVKGLARMAARGALVEDAGGERRWVATGEIEPGMHIHLGAGDRVPVDAQVVSGQSDLDCSLVSGESVPQAVVPGMAVRAGTLNLTGPLTIEATARAENSFLAEMVRLMEAAEGGKARYRRIADRAAQLYAPVVHLTAFLSFIGWLWAGGDWHQALTIAIAVLIITCPCALGLAVPIVQVVAARRLFERGIMVKDGSAMERLAEADMALFDKTGTLTIGQPRLADAGDVPPHLLAVAADLASHSRHPVAQSLAAYRDTGGAGFSAIREEPGHGIEGRSADGVWRLGRKSWAVTEGTASPTDGLSATTLSLDGREMAVFRFSDRIRPGAAQALQALAGAGLPSRILSGDHGQAVGDIARRLGDIPYEADMLPSDKVARVQAASAEGHRVLMVGDGLNDAPALNAAHVSMAPATAADIGRNAADFVFLRDSLDAVPVALTVSKRAGQLIRQNFAIAVIYNIIAVPLAITGHVTPLLAAVAMSGSSILVISNAMRLMMMRLAAVREDEGLAGGVSRLEPGE
ncbi:nitrogen fixation protein FixI [Zhengella mangrovi]|uniref:Nitrogen fixation protein FixI n=1 Tax=Zhengella mangrovi TaxID=1982044 RepID=A0A2G1QLR6_9HYPH|nr:cation-translocating P-type ATPase [Zhengella mangrovi]PHP66466.1 nitrogen fixation protein FixI [Zhengella mangrovi]